MVIYLILKVLLMKNNIKFYIFFSREPKYSLQKKKYITHFILVFQ